MVIFLVEGGRGGVTACLVYEETLKEGRIKEKYA